MSLALRVRWGRASELRIIIVGAFAVHVVSRELCRRIADKQDGSWRVVSAYIKTGRESKQGDENDRVRAGYKATLVFIGTITVTYPPQTPNMAAPKHYKIGVCLYPGCTGLDFYGSVELLSCMDVKIPIKFPEIAAAWVKPLATTEFVYLSHTLESVEPLNGPNLVVNKTYDDPSNADINVLLIPGGKSFTSECGCACSTHVRYPAMSGDGVPQEMKDFLKRQVPKLDYLLSVCTGSWIVALLGLLNGKRATTNKSMFKVVQVSRSPGKM